MNSKFVGILLIALSTILLLVLNYINFSGSAQAYYTTLVVLTLFNLAFIGIILVTGNKIYRIRLIVLTIINLIFLYFDSNALINSSTRKTQEFFSQGLKAEHGGNFKLAEYYYKEAFQSSSKFEQMSMQLNNKISNMLKKQGKNDEALIYSELHEKENRVTSVDKTGKEK